jgi:5-methylcytosine-specific restriction endonuclease McrA
MLSSIPDRELVARLEALRRNERASSTDILHHLIEVERRGLYLRLGYSSMFAYCTGHLRYAEAAAAQRVHAARCLRRFPSVGPRLQSGEISLITLGLVANLLTEATLDSWLERIRGKTQREVEALAAAVRPPMTLRDRARLVQVAVPKALPLAPTPVATDASKPQHSLPTLSKTEECAERVATAISQPGPAHEGSQPPPAPVTTQAKVYIQFLADQSFMTKYRVAAGLLSNRLARLTFEAVFTALIDDFIRRHEPVQRHERREQAALRARDTGGRPAIPLRTRDAVFARDGGRCTFVGSDGKRCNETIRLHVDHIKPVARGGSNDSSNLRLLCARHNQLQAERLLGREAMKAFRNRS